MDVLFRGPLRNLQLEVGPAAGFVQSENRNQQRSRPDQKELQDFVENGRAQAAQRYVNRNRQRRDPDAEIDVPSQHDLHDLGHGKHIDAAHEHGHEGERNGRQRAAGLAETQLQISRHRVGFGDVVERHHHQRQEQHRRNGADPIPVRRQNAVLVGRSGPAHQFECAEIGGEKAEAGNPGGHLAAGHEEVFAGVGAALQVQADGQNQGEIESDDCAIDSREMHQLSSHEHRQQWHHFFSFA